MKKAVSAKKVSQRPKTKLNLEALIEKEKITELAALMGIPYTNIYRCLKPGYNPTLLLLEQFADGLSKLKNKKISVIDLLNPE